MRAESKLAQDFICFLSRIYNAKQRQQSQSILTEENYKAKEQLSHNLQQQSSLSNVKRFQQNKQFDNIPEHALMESFRVVFVILTCIANFTS